jgi:hypothetical protein
MDTPVVKDVDSTGRDLRVTHCHGLGKVINELAGQPSFERRLEPRISKTTNKERDTRSTATLREIITCILCAAHLKMPIPVAAHYKG